MAKSTRSKVKRSFRSKKRETGVYAATEAARLNRLNAKLVSLAAKDHDGDIPVEDVEESEGLADAGIANTIQADAMEVVESRDTSSKRISTHGPRRSRREEWRTSKGLEAKPTPKGMNRQGGLRARRKAGRPARRR